ncbi:MAG: OB-fold nucleic acid binding domain-containing protein [Planctomycetota bacterium]
MSDGQQVEQSFRASDKQLRVNRQGGKYILMKLGDRSGKIAAMMWNADERVFDTFDRGDFVFCKGRTQVHNGALQIIVTDVERMDPSEVDASDFEEFDAEKSEELVAALKTLLQSIEDPYLQALSQAYLADAEFMARLGRGAAAVSHHHAYPGGLLQHTVDLMTLCDLMAPRYPQLNRDQLLFGAFLHDLGKIEELSSEDGLTYTDAGQLLGHIVLGTRMLDEKIAGLANGMDAFPQELRLQLQHMIVSHHGQLEYGSPRLPLTLEAVALHHLDNLDAKLASYSSIIDADVSGEETWTNYTPSIGRKLWKKDVPRST